MHSMHTPACPLCESASTLCYSGRQGTYFRCSGCRSAFLDPALRLSRSEEKARYDLHNNDVADPRYRAFGQPMADMVMAWFTPSHRGLDFGAGSGPVISRILEEHGFQTALYDPFYHDNPDVLKQEYDYIICCEVIEHFHDPKQTFMILRKLLGSGGKLFCRTSLLHDDVDFPLWYYKNDETHVFFYHPEACTWIADRLGFSGVRICGHTYVIFSG